MSEQLLTGKKPQAPPDTTPVQCSYCGKKNSRGRKYCYHCGKPLLYDED